MRRRITAIFVQIKGFRISRGSGGLLSRQICVVSHPSAPRLPAPDRSCISAQSFRKLCRIDKRETLEEGRHIITIIYRFVLPCRISTFLFFYILCLFSLAGLKFLFCLILRRSAAYYRYRVISGIYSIPSVRGFLNYSFHHILFLIVLISYPYVQTPISGLPSSSSYAMFPAVFPESCVCRRV